MLRFLISVVLIVILYFTLQPVLWVVVDIPPLPEQVAIRPQPGVSALDLQIAHRGIGFAAQNMEQLFGLQLTAPVNVMLTPNARSYAQTLADIAELRQETAIAQAAFSSGSAYGNQVIVNIGAIESYNDALFVVAHELAHQYQHGEHMEVSRLNWLSEGVADWVAAHAVSANLGEDPQSELSQVNCYRRDWLQFMAQQSRLPALKDLDRRTDWLASVQGYGPVAPYRTAALAVFYLMDLTDIKALRSFYALRRKGESAEKAFATAFGRTVESFEAEYSQWLQRSLTEQTVTNKAKTNGSY